MTQNQYHNRFSSNGEILASEHKESIRYSSPGSKGISIFGRPPRHHQTVPSKIKIFSQPSYSDHLPEFEPKKHIGGLRSNVAANLQPDFDDRNSVNSSKSSGSKSNARPSSDSEPKCPLCEYVFNAEMVLNLAKKVAYEDLYRILNKKSHSSNTIIDNITLEAEEAYTKLSMNFTMS